jgi:cytochrome c biogenesis protein CcmG/thiol:disulfide interchange protein DsbE
MRFWAVSGLVLSVACFAGAVAASDIDKPARKFSIKTLDQQTVRSEELKGKVVVVNRWATWCTPCQAEMVVFDKYVRAHRDSDLRIYAVATDLQFAPSKLQPLQHILAYPLATGLSGFGYGVKEGVPTTYVIDRAGVLRYAKAGAFSKESFDALITPLLNEPAPAAPASVPTHP